MGRKLYEQSPRPHTRRLGDSTHMRMAQLAGVTGRPDAFDVQRSNDEPEEVEELNDTEVEPPDSRERTQSLGSKALANIASHP